MNDMEPIPDLPIRNAKLPDQIQQVDTGRRHNVMIYPEQGKPYPCNSTLAYIDKRTDKRFCSNCGKGIT